MSDRGVFFSRHWLTACMIVCNILSVLSEDGCSTQCGNTAIDMQMISHQQYKFNQRKRFNLLKKMFIFTQIFMFFLKKCIELEKTTIPAVNCLVNRMIMAYVRSTSESIAPHIICYLLAFVAISVK